MALIVYADRLEPGDPVKITCPPEVTGCIEATVTNVSRGKKGCQIAVKHGKTTSTWHVPFKAIKPFAEMRAS